MKVFRRLDSPSPASLRNYFAEIFLDDPCVSSGIQSLVYEEREQGIVGFLGILPRPMMFQKQPVTAAVSSQFMVDTSRHRGTAALELMKRFFAGPQDLSFTDGASHGARVIWEALRGEVVPLYGLVWTRILRPASYFLDLAGSKPRLATIAKICRPLGRLTDGGATRMKPYAIPPAVTAGTDADEEMLLKCVAELSPKWALRTRYDRTSLSWILKKAGDAKTRGQLTKMVLRDTRGDFLGWYVYYAKPGGVSKVLQFGGKDGKIDDVLHHLFQHALTAGSVAVSGRLEPRFANHLSRNRCAFEFPDLFFLAHSRNSDILNVLQRGGAFLTRLDGEWWLRFHEERWEGVSNA